MLYSKQIVEYYNKVPDNMMLWSQDEANVVEVNAGSFSANEYVILQIKLNTKKQIIDCRYQVLGCGYMIALVVWLTELINKKYLNQMVNVDMHAINKAFDLPQSKQHCAMTLLSLIEKVEKLNESQ